MAKVNAFYRKARLRRGEMAYNKETGSLSTKPADLVGKRVRLRPLDVTDYEDWYQVRVRCREWLIPWEPRPAGAPHMAEDRLTFITRCSIRDRERQIGTAYSFGLFVNSRFAGEINLSSVQRGAYQNGYVGYWIDEELAGNGYIPEGCAVLFRYAFEELCLHRLQIAIVPRNTPSRQVARKLELRQEGVAVRYLEIDGVWEDHVRYAITSEEWWEKRSDYINRWIE